MELVLSSDFPFPGWDANPSQVNWLSATSSTQFTNFEGWKAESALPEKVTQKFQISAMPVHKHRILVESKNLNKFVN